MSNFLIGLGIAFVTLIVIGGASTFWVMASVTGERVTPVTVVNAEGEAGRALLVVHPGLSDFPDLVATAFATGLAEKGWGIERTTASHETPADLSSYDLLVLASPIYGGLPAKPVQDYLARLTDLGGLRVAVVLTGAGDILAALEATADLVATTGGAVAGRYGYTTMRPNEPPAGITYPGSNVEIGIAMARDAGRALAQSQ